MKWCKAICRALGCMGLVFFVILAVLVLVLWISWTGVFAPVYETDDPADYGKIVGNHIDEIPKQFVQSFFPEEIEDSFRDVRYHYKAKKFDNCACEVWLEFTIEDEAQLEGLLRGRAKDGTFVPFRDGWVELSIDSMLELWENHRGQHLEFAQMGKVLYRESDHRVIFWALYVYDGGGTKLSELNYFFTYFVIEPSDLDTVTRWD